MSDGFYSVISTRDASLLCCFLFFRPKHKKKTPWSGAEGEPNKIYLPSTELTISEPKNMLRNKCYPQTVPKARLASLRLSARSLSLAGISFWPQTSRGQASLPLLPPTASTKHKIFFMMHKCSLSHPKLERKTKSWNSFFFITNLCKNRRISFSFIKCRNFYVFLINAISLRQMRGRCYYFNEKNARAAAMKLRWKVCEGRKLWVIESLIKTNWRRLGGRRKMHNYFLSLYSWGWWCYTMITFSNNKTHNNDALDVYTADGFVFKCTCGTDLFRSGSFCHLSPFFPSA